MTAPLTRDERLQRRLTEIRERREAQQARAHAKHIRDEGIENARLLKRQLAAVVAAAAAYQAAKRPAVKAERKAALLEALRLYGKRPSTFVTKFPDKTIEGDTTLIDIPGAFDARVVGD